MESVRVASHARDSQEERRNAFQYGDTAWVCHSLGEDVVDDLVLDGGEGMAVAWGHLYSYGAREVGDGGKSNGGGSTAGGGGTNRILCLYGGKINLLSLGTCGVISSSHRAKSVCLGRKTGAFLFHTNVFSLLT